jgi:hypothetical protein
MVDVLIPWRAGCPHREAALAWALSQYATIHPDWTVIVGECPPGAWVKAVAVDDALSRSTAGVVVVADADVWCGGLAPAVTTLDNGASWVIPHNLLHRLDQTATAAVLAGARPGSFRGRHDMHAQRPYQGYAGGGVTVLRADTLRSVPLDPRFAGWGQEDRSHARALTLLTGTPVRLGADLWHLWHPPQQRVSRSKGSQESWALAERYRRARTPEAMRSLLDEGRVMACGLR